jgi:hypothetical protein
MLPDTSAELQAQGGLVGMILPLAVELGDFIVAAPLSFFVGVVVGWAVSSRYRITKVNGRNS